MLVENGYRLFPEKWSLAAYKYIVSSGEQLLQSYFITIFITIVGTLMGVLMMGMFSYAISRSTFRYKNFFTFMAVFTMLFNGGLVPYYMVCTQLLHLRDTIWALILPLCVNAFYIVVLRTFFKTMVPESVIESAKIDGANELRIFFQIAAPIAKPGIVTIALFLTLGYWNDWFQALLFIENNKLYPVQYMLKKLESSIEFIYMYSGYIDPVKRVEIIASLPTEAVRMAMVVLATGPIIFAYPFFQKYYVRGLTVGAVKE
jgi:putative aldouronate transport system permease protein